jgi:hypothetical protein
MLDFRSFHGNWTPYGPQVGPRPPGLITSYYKKNFETPASNRLSDIYLGLVIVSDIYLGQVIVSDIYLGQVIVSDIYLGQVIV